MCMTEVQSSGIQQDKRSITNDAGLPRWTQEQQTPKAIALVHGTDPQNKPRHKANKQSASSNVSQVILLQDQRKMSQGAPIDTSALPLWHSLWDLPSAQLQLGYNSMPLSLGTTHVTTPKALTNEPKITPKTHSQIEMTTAIQMQDVFHTT